MFCRFISAHIRWVAYLFLLFCSTILYFRFGLIWMNRYIRFSYSSSAFILFSLVSFLLLLYVWNVQNVYLIAAEIPFCMHVYTCRGVRVCVLTVAEKRGKPLKTILALIGFATTFKTIPFITFISFRVYTFRARSITLFVAFHLVEVTFNVAKETPNLIRNPEMYRR